MIMIFYFPFSLALYHGSRIVVLYASSVCTLLVTFCHDGLYTLCIVHRVTVLSLNGSLNLLYTALSFFMLSLMWFTCIVDRQWNNDPFTDRVREILWDRACVIVNG